VTTSTPRWRDWATRHSARPARSHRDSVRPRAAAPGGATGAARVSAISFPRRSCPHDPGRVAARGPDGDQVRRSKPGVRATYLASTLEAPEMRAAWRGWRDRSSPSPTWRRRRLASRLPRTDARSTAPGGGRRGSLHQRVGHDFRRNTSRSERCSPTCRAPGCWHARATATPIVRDEILARLGLRPIRPRSSGALRGPIWPCAPRKSLAAASGSASWTAPSRRHSRARSEGAGRPSSTRPRASRPMKEASGWRSAAGAPARTRGPRREDARIFVGSVTRRRRARGRGGHERLRHGDRPPGCSA